jgi:hypothetical protein
MMEKQMDDFISDDDLQTFNGFLKYQAVVPSTITPEEVQLWRDMFDDNMRRLAAGPKVGLMKLQPVAGEQKYGVAIRKGSDLWLTLWVRCSRKGEVFIMYPRADHEWDAHASYHLNGTLHQKSHGCVMLPSLKRQPLTSAFKGTEHLGMYSGHGTTAVGAVCDTAAFTGVVTVEPGILGPKDGVVAIDLVEPGCEPMAFLGNQISRQFFPRDGRPSVVITIGQMRLPESESALLDPA